MICATGFVRGFRHDPMLARLVDEHGLETFEQWIVLAPDATVPGLTDETRTLALAGACAQWAFPAARHAGRRTLRRARLRPEDRTGMSYTLRGRFESRLAALVPVVAAACVLTAVIHRWWPVEAAGLMAGLGAVLDIAGLPPPARLPAGVARGAARRCSSSAS